MPRTHAQTPFLAWLAAACALGVGALGLGACGSLDVFDADSAAAPDLTQPAVLEAHVADLVAARLRALFPDVEGEVTRESIVRALARAQPDDGGALGDGSALVRERAAQALRRGDDETARALLSELAAGREAQAARALRAAGDVDGALAGYARALDIAPHSAALRRERAETALDDGLARQDRARIESALAEFQEATRRARGDQRDTARAWLGASRAARALGDVPQALDAARRAFDSARNADDLEGPSEIAERTRAEAVLAALARDSSAELAREARTALEALVARTPDDPWVWARLSEVLQENGAAPRGLRVAEIGLAIFPRDAELADALADSTRAIGGRDAVVATFIARQSEDPTDADAVWRPAEERYARALETLRGAAATPSGSTPEQLGSPARGEDGFREAGRGFLRAGALAPDRAAEANTRAARCLVGVGLALRARGELASARAAFLEAEARDPSVLASPLATGLATGVDALRDLAGVLRTRGADPSRADATDCLVEAAATYADLRRIAPGDADESVLASSVQREAALALEARARISAERGQRDAARAEMDRARVLMEAAYTSAVDAARQKPSDAVAVRTPGRLLVHFLQREREVPQAETWLQQAVKLSEAEVAAAREKAAEPGLDAAQREERARRVEEAESRLGDAYQDLGVLHLDLKGDPHGAKAWFEKALATGPDPREDLRAPGGWIERCEAAIARGTDPRISPENRWGSLP